MEVLEVILGNKEGIHHNFLPRGVAKFYLQK
jgi:hypothetical protein